MRKFSFVRNKMTRDISITESVPLVHTQVSFVKFVVFRCFSRGSFGSAFAKLTKNRIKLILSLKVG